MCKAPHNAPENQQPSEIWMAEQNCINSMVGLCKAGGGWEVLIQTFDRLFPLTMMGVLGNQWQVAPHYPKDEEKYAKKMNAQVVREDVAFNRFWFGEDMPYQSFRRYSIYGAGYVDWWDWQEAELKHLAEIEQRRSIEFDPTELKDEVDLT